MVLWHTGYVWFISDLGYLGTVVIVGLFAYILFTTIMRMFVDPGVLSVIIVQQLLLLFIYLPGNNQIFQSGEGLVGTAGILLLSVVFNHTSPASRTSGRAKASSVRLGR
jgi:hypothetical protein